MHRKPDVEQLLKDKNAAGLEMAMRFAGDAGTRRKAVKAAGRLGNNALVEALNRALREDPDGDVQREAYQALREILGNQAEKVVETYNHGPAYEDEWVLTEQNEENDLDSFPERESASGPRIGRPNLARILEEKDITGLEEAMRFGPEAEIRRLAVRAAGQWGNLELVEALVRSTQEDPEQAVRDEANEALHEMLGSRAEEVAASYNAGAEYEDEWIIADPPVELPEGDPAGDWDERSINALYMIADDPRDTVKGARAVKALAQVGTTRAVEALISLALHAETETIRRASMGVLEEYFGEDLDEVLKSYQADDDGFGEELVELALQEDGSAQAADEWAAFEQGEDDYGRAWPQTPPTLQEEGVGAVHVLLVVAATLVVIALVAMALR